MVRHFCDRKGCGTVIPFRSPDAVYLLVHGGAFGERSDDKRAEFCSRACALLWFQQLCGETTPTV